MLCFLLFIPSKTSPCGLVPNEYPSRGTLGCSLKVSWGLGESVVGLESVGGDVASRLEM